MKTYTKPSMQVLSISANDPLCLGCTGVQTRFNTALSQDLEAIYGSIVQDGVFTYEEALSASLFDPGACKDSLVDYCKMNSAVNIFTS